jgi:ribosomal protein L11 methyltransferase
VIRLGIRVRACDAELAYARLEPVLADGFEEVSLDDAVELTLYGEALPSEDELRAMGGEMIVGVTREVVERDWQRAWHEYLGRVVVGGIAVRPPWVEGSPDDIVIEPGTTFGAASHPTTRLCLEILQDRAPTALADWGTGAGTLAIAAARLGFHPVTAIELDPAAVDIARGNCAANGVSVEVQVGDVTKDAPIASTVIANLTLPLLNSLAVVPPQTLIASGFLEGQQVFLPGLVERDRRELDGWAAVVLERA